MDFKQTLTLPETDFPMPARLIERAPELLQLLTDGFLPKGRARPSSKSELQKAIAGAPIEYVPPADVIKKEDSELLRLWIASAGFRTDLFPSREQGVWLGESYQTVRNTCRYILDNLRGFDPAAPAPAALPEVDRFALEQWADFVAAARTAYDEHELDLMVHKLVEYCTTSLSAFYFDVLKDRLYCDGATSESRRSAQVVLYQIGRSLATLMAPILSFTAEEVWRHLPRRAGDPDSVHMALLPSPPETEDPALQERWKRLLELRRIVNLQLEPFRAGGKKSLDARVVLAPSKAERPVLLGREAVLADLFIVSQVEIAPVDAPELQVAIEPARGVRCPRCWKWSLDPSGDPRDPDLCRRCAAALGAP